MIRVGLFIFVFFAGLMYFSTQVKSIDTFVERTLHPYGPTIIWVGCFIGLAFILSGVLTIWGNHRENKKQEKQGNGNIHIG